MCNLHATERLPAFITCECFTWNCINNTQETLSRTSVYVNTHRFVEGDLSPVPMSADSTDEPIDEDYRARVLAAYRALCDAEHVRQLKDAEIARRMIERDPDLRTGYQQAGRLLNGTRSRHRPTMIAFARVLGVDPGWLDYGPASDAPAPKFATPVARVPKVHPKPVNHNRASEPRQAAAKKGRRGPNS